MKSKLLLYLFSVTLGGLGKSVSPASLGHIYQTLQRRGHPSLLSLHKHNPSVYVDDNTPECVQLFALVAFGN